jgi:hypothetical protein
VYKQWGDSTYLGILLGEALTRAVPHLRLYNSSAAPASSIIFSAHHSNLEFNTNMADPANGTCLPISPDSSGESPQDSRPKQASRSVSLLTPEQLQRKRAQDRESQRQTRQVNQTKDSMDSAEEAGLTACRARVKQTISQLEKRVEMLTQELHLTRLENASLREDNQLNPPGTIPAVAPPRPIPDPEFFPPPPIPPTTAIMKLSRGKSRVVDYLGVSPQFADSLIVQAEITTGGNQHPLRNSGLPHLSANSLSCRTNK